MSGFIIQVLNAYNSLLKGKKMLDLSKLKVSADVKIHATEKLEFVFGRVGIRNHCGKTDVTGKFSPTVFSKVFLLKVIKSCDFVIKS